MADGKVNKFKAMYNNKQTTSTDEIAESLYSSQEKEVKTEPVKVETKKIEEPKTEEKATQTSKEFAKPTNVETSKRKPGRPKQEDPDDYASNSVHIKVTDELRDKILVASAARKMNSSAYVRSLIEKDLETNYASYEKMKKLMDEFQNK